MDSDALKRKEDYRRILGDFRAGKIDILLGTQMIAKGLHFPNVTLVGIIYADLALHMPDFRAGERTFQLLTQVAGPRRARRCRGRGVRADLHAVSPGHPIRAAARFRRVSTSRKSSFASSSNIPPLSRVALLTLKGRNEDKVKFSAEHLKRELDKALAGFKGLVLAGPAPAPLLRAETFYRYQIMLRGAADECAQPQTGGNYSRMTLPEDVTLVVDIDPVDLF